MNTMNRKVTEKRQKSGNNGGHHFLKYIFLCRFFPSEAKLSFQKNLIPSFMSLKVFT